jgi:hypothetical protein
VFGGGNIKPISSRLNAVILGENNPIALKREECGVADKGEELVQYITQRVVAYIETPKEERKRARRQRRDKEAWQRRWFGVVPFALSMWVEQLKTRKKHRKHQKGH